MKGSIIGLIVFVATAASFSLGWYLNDSSNYSRAKDLYSSRIRALEAQKFEEIKKKQELLGQLEQKSHEILELKSQVSQNSISNKSDVLKLPERNKPLTVRTYFEGKLIGDSELIFAGARRVRNDDGTYKIVKEPVVRLPVKYKSLFTQTLTNIVEKPVVKRETTYNSNYYSDNRGVFPNRWGYGQPVIVNSATPVARPNQGQGNAGAYFNGNPHIRNDEVSKPRVR